MLQNEIDKMNKIYSIIIARNDINFDSFEYVYRVNEIEGWSSQRLTYWLNNEVVMKNDFTSIDEQLLEIISQELHDEMQKNLKGDWKKMIFVLNKTGEVNTKFDYNEQSLLD
ncbi:hypothetical protein [Lonepinella sp. MS14436]|uniref:hypothetical protein n=1 Tax=Lonepinella sp. MS14436 TaxID=3003619 RepID=UPI0036DD0AC7